MSAVGRTLPRGYDILGSGKEQAQVAELVPEVVVGEGLAVAAA